jgi:hypothetical protein
MTLTCLDIDDIATIAISRVARDEANYFTSNASPVLCSVI